MFNAGIFDYKLDNLIKVRTALRQHLKFTPRGSKDVSTISFLIINS